jgi:aconitate hydratase
VVGPHSPDRARPISQLAAEVQDESQGFVDEISAAFIGSCTNSSYQDMSRAASVAEQALARGVRASVPLWVAPGSERTRATIERDGQLEALRKVGATVLASACGPCIGQWRRTGDATEGEAANSIVTSFNRNFPGRNDGRTSTQGFIASPEIVTAFAIAGRLSFDPLRDTLTDAQGRPFRLEPHVVGPHSPDRARPISQLAAEVQDESQGFVDEISAAIKTRGKTTTDQISPAGEWLRYRGHLERFSDNLLSGAIDAFSGRTRPGFASEARDLRARGVRWVIVGDANYGEGSSREHAALSPRLLGCAAVIARSFARIHESNLKKQGILALTFRDPADYDEIREGDLLNLVGLAQLAENRGVECVALHGDGSTTRLELRHSYTEAQLPWFRAGSALNAIRQGEASAA